MDLAMMDQEDFQYFAAEVACCLSAAARLPRVVGPLMSAGGAAYPYPTWSWQGLGVCLTPRASMHALKNADVCYQRRSSDESTELNKIIDAEPLF